MKPPPRKRSKPKHRQDPEPSQVTASSGWYRVERRKLLRGLKKLRFSHSHNQDIDYTFLKTCVPSRSVEEIRSMVESLKDKAASHASCTLMKNQRQKMKLSKPIELWAEMASAVVGTLELPIATAFSQVLKIASIEPRTLNNCDHPQLHKAHTNKDKPCVQTVPLKTVPCSPVPGQHPGPSIAQSQAPSTGSEASGKLSNPNSRSAPVSIPQSVGTNLTVPVPGVQPCPGSAAMPKALCSEPQVTQQPPAPVLPSSSSQRPASSPRLLLPSSAASAHSTRALLPPAATLAAKLKDTCKRSTQDTSKEDNAIFSVDFDKIYRYLSLIHTPDGHCHLTAMESAIVLDLLMSLPEEVRLLDYNKLRNHLIQVYACLSSPTGSKEAQQMFPGLKDGPSSQHSNTTKSEQDAATTVSSSGDKNVQPDGAKSQLPERQNTSSQSVDKGKAPLCPPLNPFMIPVKLLMRK